MNSVTVTVDPMSTLPIYLVMATGLVLALISSAAQRGLRALTVRHPDSTALRFVGSRLGSAAILLALYAALLSAMVFLMVPSY